MSSLFRFSVGMRQKERKLNWYCNLKFMAEKLFQLQGLAMARALPPRSVLTSLLRRYVSCSLICKLNANELLCISGAQGK